MSDRILNPSRRQFLTRGGTGLGALALNYLLRQENSSALFADAAKPSLNPLSPKPGHHAASAKSVIWLFMEGGPSHLDLFDPKPTLDKLAGQPMPASFGRPITAMGTGANALMPSQAHVQAVRPERHLGFRLVSADRGARGRHRRHPLLLG